MIRSYRLRSLARVSSSLRSRSQNIRNDDSVDQNIQIFLSVVEIVIEISLDPEELFPFLIRTKRKKMSSSSDPRRPWLLWDEKKTFVLSSVTFA